MKHWILRKSVIGVTVGIFLVLALSLYVVFDGETVKGDIAEGDLIGEPLDEDTKAMLQAGHLKFIAETGRVIVNERGVREIIWDPPELPTLKESILRATVAKIMNNPDLLPLCTEEYSQYLREQKEAAGIRNNPSNHSFPACNAIPDGIYRGLPSVPGFVKHKVGNASQPSNNQ